MKKFTVDNCKEQAHACIDVLYELMCERSSLCPSNRVDLLDRRYAIDVKGNYDFVILGVSDEWCTHYIHYHEPQHLIELRDDTLLVQRTLKPGCWKYNTLTNELDDLISLIERWRDLTV